jgi:hypothetical protein
VLEVETLYELATDESVWEPEELTVTSRQDQKQKSPVR